MKYKSTELHQVNYLRDEFLQGNNDAFARLYQALAPALYSMGLSFRAKKDIIEDALHDKKNYISCRRSEISCSCSLKKKTTLRN